MELQSEPARTLRGPFLRYMAGETVSMLGTWIQQTAQGWVLAGLTASAFTLGTVNFISGAPMLLLSLWAGAVADRVDKRVLLGTVVLLQAAVSVWLGTRVAAGNIAVWHVAVAGICLGVTTAFEMPAAAALVPELVGKDQIRHAMAIDRAVFHATRLAGPAVGGWLIASLGTASAFHANAASFLALLISLATLPPASCKPRETAARENKGVLEGFRHVQSDPPSAAMLLLISQITLFISPYFMILMPLYSRHVLEIGPEQHGLLMGASGGGAFLGALHLLRIRPERRSFYLGTAATFTSLSMAVLSQARSLSVALPAIALMTLGNSTLFGLANTLVQERAPDPVRGRVSALAGLSFFGVLPFAGLAASKLADTIGLRTAMLSGACCFAAGSALVLFRIRHGLTEYRPKPTPEAPAP